jgi:DNA-binding transcriptional LysR family regulator
VTLEQLRIFVAVAEREHLTRAAGALHLSPSAVSAAIKALEQRYDTALFHRVGRGIELTGMGREFLGQARATLAAAESAERVLEEASGLQHGRLRVEASQTIMGYWIPDVLLRFHTAYPGVELLLRAGNTATVSQAVAGGVADLGFIEGEIDDPMLGQKIVAEDRLIVVVAPRHPWADGRPLTPDQILQQGWILREEGSGTRSMFVAALRAARIDPARLKIAMSLPANEAVRIAVAGGLLAGVMSERVADAYLAAGRLVRANYALPPRAFRMLWHKERYRSRAAQALEAMLGMAEPDGGMAASTER